MIRRLISAQLLATAIAGLLALGFGSEVSVAVVLGASIGIATSGYFARRVLGSGAAGEPLRLAAGMCGAEVVKLALASILFCLVFAWVDGVNALALIAGYLAVHLSASIAPVLMESTAPRAR